MATYARKLKDSYGNFVAPATRATCVYMSDDTTLEDFVNNLDLRVTGIYPVGSIYQSFEDTSPASMFGGEWEKLENTFLYGSGTKNVGNTGGEETHSLVERELPLITGEVRFNQWITIRNTEQDIIEYANGCFSKSAGDYHQLQQDAAAVPFITSCRTFKIRFGGNIAHNNMPPYTVLNIWKRVA